MLSNTSLKVASLALGLMLVAGCQHQGATQADAGAQATKPAAAQAQRPSVSAQQSAPQRQAQAEQTVITVHLAQQQSESSLLAVDLDGANKLYALPQPILTQADMQQVTPVTAADGSTYIMFEMTPQGRVKLADVSRQAQGHFFLISAKGQLISVAQIAEPMTDGKLLISTNGAGHTQQVLQLLR